MNFAGYSNHQVKDILHKDFLKPEQILEGKVNNLF